MLNRFKLYSVQVNPSSARPYETAEFVPEGFNFFAFAFGPLWALYHRLWVLAFILVCLGSIPGSIGNTVRFQPAEYYGTEPRNPSAGRISGQ